MNRPTVAISSLAYALPSRPVGNSDLLFEKIPAIPPNWWKFWGIESRKVMDPAAGENAMTLASGVCTQALRQAGLAAEQVDLILANTTSPYIPPSTSGEGILKYRRIFPRLSYGLKHALGATRALSWDIEVECASFLYQLQIAANFIKQGRYKNVLICSCEQMSGVLDYTSVSSTSFGDGAVAAVISAEAGPGDLLASTYISDAEFYDVATIRWRFPENLPPEERTAEDFGAYFTLRKDGVERIAKFMPETVPAVVHRVLEKAGISKDEVNAYVFHQPSKVLVDAWAARIGNIEGRYESMLKDCGCLVSASVAVTLHEAIARQKISPGDLVVLAGAGAGWGYGAQLWRVGDIQISASLADPSFQSEHRVLTT